MSEPGNAKGEHCQLPATANSQVNQPRRRPTTPRTLRPPSSETWRNGSGDPLSCKKRSQGQQYAREARAAPAGRQPAPPPSGTPVASAQGLDPDPPRDRGPLTTRHPEPGSPSKRTLAAHARNVTRIQIANAADRDTLGEFPLVGEEKGSARGDPSSPPETQEAQTRAVSHHYLPQLAEAFLPEVVQAPDDTFPTPPWFLRALTEIARAPVTTPSKPPFRFEVSPEAAEHNARLLAEKDFDVGRFLGSHQDTTLGYGCEFRPPAQLEPLLGLHPHFGLLEDLLRNGMSYHYKVELSEAERTEELAAILARGNHKSATAESAQVLLLLTKDVTHGFSVRRSPGSWGQRYNHWEWPPRCLWTTRETPR